MKEQLKNLNWVAHAGGKQPLPDGTPCFAMTVHEDSVAQAIKENGWRNSEDWYWEWGETFDGSDLIQYAVIPPDMLEEVYDLRSR